MGSLDEIDFGDSQKKSIKSSSIKDIPKRFKGRRLNGGSMCGTCNGKKCIKVLHPTGDGKRLNDARGKPLVTEGVEYTRTWEPCPDCNSRIQSTQ